ncbi:MAG: ABC transporter permease [Nanoarchaeota archaeon]|nr:ABC transporter permease [Nanoarchaeota archaeon]
MISNYFGLALKNLRHRGIRSWLTLLGIFIGVAAVVSLISLGDGLKLAVTSQFGISSNQIITVEAGGISNAGPPGAGAAESLVRENIDAIEKVSGVEFAFGRIISYGKLDFNRRVNVVPMMSAPTGEVKEDSYEADNLKIVYGGAPKDSDINKVVLGWNFYNNEDIFGKKILPGSKVLVQDKEFEVAGILGKAGSFIFDNIIIINEDSLRNLLDYGERVDLISVKVRDPKNIERVKEEIEKVMRVERDVKKGEENFAVSTPEAGIETVNQVIGGVQAFIAIIASISILVGAIGIVNTMTTSVLERKKEIGIMKAIGAKNSQIFVQFFIESGLLGLVGGIIGVVIGIALGYYGTIGINAFIGASIKPSINFYLIFMTLIVSFVIGSVAGIVPALNAAKQNPVEALRG